MTYMTLFLLDLKADLLERYARRRVHPMERVEKVMARF